MRNPYKEKDGKKYLHVTSGLSIIRMEWIEKWRGDYGNVECDRMLNESRNKGKVFHHYRALIDLGQGDEINFEELNDEMKKWVFYYREWFFENVEEVIQVEEGLFSEKHLYYGRPDSLLRLKGRVVPDLVDAKTGKYVTKKDHYQLAGYKELLKENGVQVHNRIILHCRKKLIVPGTGEMLLDPQDHDSDFRMFLYAAALFRDQN